MKCVFCRFETVFLTPVKEAEYIVHGTSVCEEHATWLMTPSNEVITHTSMKLWEYQHRNDNKDQ